MHDYVTVVVDNHYQQAPFIGAGTSAAPGAGTTFVDVGRKWKRLVLGEEDIIHLTLKIEAVKPVSVAITNSSHLMCT
jgi:hypothetical protein